MPRVCCQTSLLLSGLRASWALGLWGRGGELWAQAPFPEKLGTPGKRERMWLSRELGSQDINCSDSQPRVHMTFTSYMCD